MDSKELCRLIILMILIKDPLATTQDRSVKVLVVMVGSVNIVGQLLSIWPRLVQYSMMPCPSIGPNFLDQSTKL